MYSGTPVLNMTNHGTDVGWSCYRGGHISEVENLGVNLLNYTRIFTPVNYHLRLQCLYNCQKLRDSIHVFMVSRGHYPSRQGVNYYQHSIFGHVLGDFCMARC
jgi:hypothetical protein